MNGLSIKKSVVLKLIWEKKKEKNKNGLQTIWKIVFFLDGIG